MGHYNSPWNTTNQLLINHAGTWEQVDEDTLAKKKHFRLPPFYSRPHRRCPTGFGQSIFTDVLHQAPGTQLVNNSIQTMQAEQYSIGTTCIDTAEEALAQALRQNTSTVDSSSLGIDTG